jgi:GNAT superfamily N-acetyltransferase
MPIVERIEGLDQEAIRAIHALEQNMPEGQRLPEDVLVRFLRSPQAIKLVARERPACQIIGYCFGLSQTVVPETGRLCRDIIGSTFYEMSWQVFQEQRGHGIGKMLRHALRDAARQAHRFFATHQRDSFTREQLEQELQDYGQGDAIHFLQRALPPPPGTNIFQQYVVIRLRPNV